MYNLFETLLYVSDCLGTVVATGSKEKTGDEVSETLDCTEHSEAGAA